MADGWHPGICRWCGHAALVTTLVREDRRDFCGACLDRLASANSTPGSVAQDGQHLA